jgi:hypothetical protein
MSHCEVCIISQPNNLFPQLFVLQRCANLKNLCSIELQMDFWGFEDLVRPFLVNEEFLVGRIQRLKECLSGALVGVTLPLFF